MVPTELRRILLSAALFCLAATSNASDDALLTPTFHSCIKAAAGVDPVILECQSQEFSRQDSRLNSVYQKLLAKLSAEKAKELRSVQRSWVAYVKGKCDFYYDNQDFNGTLNRIEASYCFVAERARRAEELERISKW